MCTLGTAYSGVALRAIDFSTQGAAPAALAQGNRQEGSRVLNRGGSQTHD